MFGRTVVALALVVRVYDNAGVAAGEIEAARDVAHAILKEAGIAVTWQNDGPVAPSDLIIRIVAAPPTSVPDSLGFSFVDVGRELGTLATVFVDRVHALSARARASSGRLLGRAMAHEIGHLLLGTTSHADRGLMRGVWTTIDLQKEQPWDWALPREDSAGMRRGLAARLRRLAPPATVVAQK